jgi:hypothetical protein
MKQLCAVNPRDKYQDLQNEVEPGARVDLEPKMHVAALQPGKYVSPRV